MEKTQLDILAEYIMAEIPGEPSHSEGVGDCAVRMLKFYRDALSKVKQELGVPGPGYMAPVANAYDIADAALRGYVIDFPLEANQKKTERRFADFS